MALIAAFALLLAGSTALLVALAGIVLWRKALRDVRESRSARRRRRLARVLATQNPRHLRRELARIRFRQAQVDLAAELQRAAALPADLARQAARAGLIARLDRQLRARHAPTRGRAALLLAQIRLPDGVRRLERLLDDEDPVRLVTVAGLPLSQDPAAVHALVRALSHRRLAPERVIERVGRPWAVPPLLESLERLDAAGEPGPPRGSGSHARSAWPAICGRSRR